MSRPARVDDLLRVTVPSAPALSPDGTRVVHVLTSADAGTDTTVRRLWQAHVASGEVGPLTDGPADTAPAWSPDGRWLAFLRAQDGPAQLWLLPAAGGPARQVTRLPLGAGAPVWSPAGDRIAFSCLVDPDAVADEDDAARTRRERAPVVADLLDHQPDGVGRLGRRRRHVHVVDLGPDGSGTACRQLTHGDWHAGDPAWSPDGRRLALPGQSSPDRDLAARAPLHVLDVDDPQPRPDPVALVDGLASTVLWTPDGASLVVVGTAGDPVGHAHLLRVPLDGGAPVDLAPGLDRNVMPGGPGYPGAAPALTDGGGTVLFCVRDAGCTHLYAVGLDGGDPRPVVDGPSRVVQGCSVAGGAAAVVLATPDAFGEVVLVDLARRAETVLTSHGAALADVALLRREERTFTISDGTPVQGWLLRDPARPGPLPLLLDVHGGPHNASNGAADDVHLYQQELAARGWAVLVVNPRGSDGYGERFYRGVDGAWGVADAQDLLEPLDALVAEGVADPDRLALTGYSYGGFMTCYLTGTDGRFAAAVAGGVVSDMVSSVGTSDDGAAMARYELGAQPWQDREAYARMSPYERVDRVRTPTLVLHGAEDTRCPVGQALQWHAGLRAQGVPTRLVLYPGGSHLFVLDGPPSHRTDYGRRLVDWVERYAPAPAARAPRTGGEGGVGMELGQDPLVDRMTAALPRVLDDVAELVRCESPSADLDAVARSAEVVARVGERWLGAAPDRIVLDGRTHLRWRLGTGPARVLLLGHHDTVWPIGSLETHPCAVTDGVLRGPGCLDMKAGLVLAFAAVAELADRDGVTVLVTGDEELGSPSSRALIEAEAEGCAGALVLEAAADGGALKTERKGVSLYRVQVHGRASHAGLDPAGGINAAVEVAHQVLAVAALGDGARGTTVTPTVTTAGTASNTVPAQGGFAVDVRVRDAAEQARVDAAVRALRPVLPGARLEVTGGPNRAPLDAGSSAALFARAAALADGLGLPALTSASVGGASDGNFTAGIGVPTLDGLGASGGGAHAADEHVLVAELPGRAAVVAALLADLLGRPLAVSGDARP